MSVSEQQTELNELTTDLACLAEGDTVILVTDNGSVSATVTVSQWRADDAVVVFEERDADRRIHVYTEHHGGWLDPLVDVETADTDDPEVLRPFGSPMDIHRVSATDDVSEHYGRP